MNHRLFAALIVSSFSLIGCQTVWISSTETLELSAEGLQRLVCSSADGRVSLVGDPGAKSVRVSVRKRVGGYDDADAAAAL